MNNVSGSHQQAKPGVDLMIREAHTKLYTSHNGNVYKAAVEVICKYEIMDYKVHQEIVDGLKSMKSADERAKQQPLRAQLGVQRLPTRRSWIHEHEARQDTAAEEFNQVLLADPAQQQSTRNEEQLTLF